jgi:GAF domain-containing protein
MQASYVKQGREWLAGTQYDRCEASLHDSQAIPATKHFAMGEHFLDMKELYGHSAITRITSDLLSAYAVDTCLLSLRDQENAFSTVACYKDGTNLQWESFSLQGSCLCAARLRRRAPLIVEDALSHTLYQNDPLVAPSDANGNPPCSSPCTGGIRFFVELPLIFSTSCFKGTLCLADSKKRQNFRLSDADFLVAKSVELIEVLCELGFHAQ